MTQSGKGKCLALTLALVGLGPSVSSGMAWDVVPIASVGMAYESNPRSVPENRSADDAWAGVGEFELDIRADTETSSVRFRPSIRGAEYTGATRADDLNYLDLFFPVDTRWTAQRAQYQVNGGYTKTSTRNFPGVDPNLPPDSPLQRPATDEYQERWSLSPSGMWQIDPRNMFSLGASFDDIDYSEARELGRFNYQTALANATWTRSLTSQHNVSIGTNINAFFAEIPGSTIENDTVSYGANVGYEYLWSETTSVGASLGGAFSDISLKGLPAIGTPNGPLPCLDPNQNAFVLCEIKSDDQNFVGQLFFRRNEAETITTEFSVSRAIQPSSDGAQVTSDNVRVFVTKDFRPRLSGSLGVTYSQQEAVGARSDEGRIGQRFTRNYWSTEGSLNWRITRQWWLRTSYAFYRDDQEEGANNAVDRHRVNLNLQYNGERAY